MFAYYKDRRRRRGWRLCRLPGLWRRADPAREWRTRKSPTCATQTWTASLSGAECRRWQDTRASPGLKARLNASAPLPVFVPALFGRGPTKCGVLRRARAGDGPGAKLIPATDYDRAGRTENTATKNCGSFLT